MHRHFRSENRLPKSFYEKAQELQKQASLESDPVLKQLEIDAAKRYYEEDVKPKEPFLTTLVALVFCWVVIIVVAILAYHTLGFLSAAGSVIGSFAVLSLLTGVALRAAGYISESTLLGIIKTGSRTLLLLRRNPPPIDAPTNNQDRPVVR